MHTISHIQKTTSTKANSELSFSGSFSIEALTSSPPAGKSQEGKFMAGKCPAVKCPQG